MKKLRMLFNILCVVGFLTAIVSVRVNADNYYGYLKYSLSNNAVTITDYHSSLSGNVIIPSTIDGYPVTTIGNSAFWSCKKITSVTIPSSVKTIGAKAFGYCTNLTSIDVPDGVTSIGADAFYDCYNLKSIDIPDSITVINAHTFYRCMSLTKITIPESITAIGDGAFLTCTGLTSVTIPDSVTSIGESAFAKCTGLTSVNLGNGVKTLGMSAFDDCSNMSSIIVGKSLKSLSSYTFRNCTSLQTVYYGGTPEEWSLIYVPSYSYNTAFTSANLVYLNKYTISYNANGGTGAPGSQTKTQYMNIKLSSSVPTRTGYTFKGWATSSTASYASYNPGDNYTNDRNVTLYAVWQLKTYSITYNANGGTGAPSSQTKTHGVDITLSSTIPTKTGYNFKGWSTSYSSTSGLYNPGATYTANSNVTLYAIWQIKTYSITYNANGGTGAPSDQTKTHGVNITLSSTLPTREGYTFNGWSTSANSGVGEKVLSVTGIESDHNYTENANQSWTISSPGAFSIELTFDSRTSFESNYDWLYIYDNNDNQVGRYSGTTLAGMSVTVPGDFVKLKLTSDYSTNKWGFKVISATAKTADLYDLGATYTFDKSIVLYAQWTANTYTIIYNANGGENTPDTQTKTHDIDLVLNSAIPTRENYNFLGWSTSADGEVEYDPSDNYIQNESVTLYAIWEIIPPEPVDPVSLSEISIYDSTYKPLDTIPATSFIAEFIVKNISYDGTPTIILAYYDNDGKMLGVRYLYPSPAKGQERIIGASITNTDGKVAKVKAMVFDNLSSFVPLTESVEINK